MFQHHKWEYLIVSKSSLIVLDISELCILCYILLTKPRNQKVIMKIIISCIISYCISLQIGVDLQITIVFLTDSFDDYILNLIIWFIKFTENN